MDASPDSYKYLDSSASQLTEARTTSLSFAAGGGSWLEPVEMKAWFTDKTTSTISLRRPICINTIFVSSVRVSASTFIWRHKNKSWPEKEA